MSGVRQPSLTSAHARTHVRTLRPLARSVVAQGGGADLLQIQDNGHGIRVRRQSLIHRVAGAAEHTLAAQWASERLHVRCCAAQREDLAMLCERHTTSKLRQFEDLRGIRTLGFRGEALASISYVARLSVLTMTAGSEHGWRADYTDGVLDKGSPKPAAATKGTTITVEGLYQNVPLRRKVGRTACLRRVDELRGRARVTGRPLGVCPCAGLEVCVRRVLAAA